MKINFIDLKRQQSAIKTELDNAIHKVLSHGNYIMGNECKELEKKLSEYVGVDYCLGCANGTDAIRLALLALGVKKGDVILTTNFTFFATAEVIAELGAIPIYVDIDETYNICVVDLENKIKTLKNQSVAPVGIVSVDLFGLPANHIEINRIAKDYNLWHVEDAAQGFGGKIGNDRACSFADISTTSFFPAKPLGCYGDGGAIFTNNTDLANIIESLRVHGKGAHKYENVRVGYNSRLDTLQASILLEKLKIFDSEVEKKSKIAETYTNSISHISEVIVPKIPKNFTSSWAQYTLQVEKRDELVSYLKSYGIPTAIYYPKTMSQTKALKIYSNYQIGNLNKSEKIISNVISLPMHAYLENDEVKYICDKILRFYGE